MTAPPIEIILRRAKELYPEAKPRIISDNGPQFIAKDFKEFIRISGMTHVRTSLPGASREFRANGTVSWKRRGNNGRVVASSPREEQHCRDSPKGRVQDAAALQ